MIAITIHGNHLHNTEFKHNRKAFNSDKNTTLIVFETDLCLREFKDKAMYWNISENYLIYVEKEVKSVEIRQHVIKLKP